MKPHKCWGYPRIGLGRGNKDFIHRLVAKAFCEKPERHADKSFDELLVNHKDESRDNNYFENLEWVDHLENCLYGTGIQRCVQANTNHPNKSYPVAQYTLSGKFVAVYPSIKEVERTTGISNRRVGEACRGLRKEVSGYIWKHISREEYEKYVKSP